MNPFDINSDNPFIPAWLKTIDDYGYAEFKELNVTENGEYESEEGEAYVKVNVDVEGGASVVTIASGTITPSEKTQSLAIPVGKSMAQKDFLFIIYAPTGTTFEYENSYKQIIGGFVCDGDVVSYDLSTNGTDILPTPKGTYGITFDGTTTNYTPDAIFGSSWYARNGSVASTSIVNGHTKITREDSGFTLTTRIGNGYWQNSITYTYKIIYYGSDPDNDIVTVP